MIVSIRKKINYFFLIRYQTKAANEKKKETGPEIAHTNAFKSKIFMNFKFTGAFATQLT
jgi:hypothetical protein